MLCTFSNYMKTLSFPDFFPQCVHGWVASKFCFPPVCHDHIGITHPPLPPPPSPSYPSSPPSPIPYMWTL